VGSARCADQTPQCGIPTLAHSAAHEDEIHHQYNREQVGEQFVVAHETSLLAQADLASQSRRSRI
jgi:hypothetical protein